MSILGGTSAHLRFLGRPVIPLLLSLAVATFAFFWYQLVQEDAVLADRFWADFTGFFAGAAAAFLAFSWWWRSQRLLLVGLAIATGVMTARTVLLVTSDVDTSRFAQWSAASWALAAGLTFLMEMRSDYLPSAVRPFRLRGRRG